jgi:hypothetical protein
MTTFASFQWAALLCFCCFSLTPSLSSLISNLHSLPSAIYYPVVSMPHIERDPGLEICPDFTSPHYDPLHNLITNAGATEEEAMCYYIHY